MRARPAGPGGSTRWPGSSAYERSLSERLLAAVAETQGLSVVGRDDAVGRPPTFGLDVAGVAARDTAARLAALGIFTWAGDHYATEVMARLGRTEERPATHRDGALQPGRGGRRRTRTQLGRWPPWRADGEASVVVPSRARRPAGRLWVIHPIDIRSTPLSATAATVAGGDAAGRLQHDPACCELDRGLEIRQAHVVQKHYISARFDGGLQPSQVFDLRPQTFTMWPDTGLSFDNGPADPSGRPEVVVLDQHCVEQPESVVVPSTLPALRTSRAPAAPASSCGYRRSWPWCGQRGRPGRAWRWRCRRGGRGPLRQVRSAASTDRAGPLTEASAAPLSTAVPSATSCTLLTVGSTISKTSATSEGRPRHPPRG